MELLKQEEEKVFQKEPDFWSREAKKNMIGDKNSVVNPLFLSQVSQYYNDFSIRLISKSLTDK